MGSCGSHKAIKVCEVISVMTHPIKLSILPLLRGLFVCLFMLAGLSYIQGLQAQSAEPTESFLSESEPERPNIILIVSDDQGYNELSPVGNRDIHTPALDRLAKEGTRLTNFYVTGPGCTPSRSGFLTGRYPQRNGLYDMIRNDWAPSREPEDALTPLQSRRQPEMTLGLDEREYLISDMLKKAGYINGIFGKWDFGRLPHYLPLQRGFDDFLGIVNTGTDYWTHERYGTPSLYRNNELVNEDGFLIELEGREVERFIREHHDRPFFLYYPSFAPHMSSNLSGRRISPPQKYVDLYKDLDVSDRYREHLAAISSLDAQIGNMLDLLDEYEIAANTLIIFFSDQGAGGLGDNTPFRGGKGNLWEGGVRVPFLARWPGIIPEGTVSDTFVSSLDLMPTLASVAGTSIPDAIMDGRNMISVLKGDPDTIREEMFWEWHGQRAARIGNYKWVDIDGETGGLFDLSQDKEEQIDLSDEEPEQLKRMVGRWDDWRQEMEDAEYRGPFPPWNEYLREFHRVGHGPVHHWLTED